jgi:hypothetical protein
MQISFRFDHAIVTVRFFGEYAFDDAKAAFLLVLPDVKSAHVRGTLVDVSESWSFLTRSQLELESIGVFVASVRELLGARMAILARTDMTYDLACVVGASARKQGLPVRIFRKEEAARAWLIDMIER